MTPLEIALEHASRGFRVLTVYNVTPSGDCSCKAGKNCHSPGKHPSLTDWPNLATTDPDLIRELWGERPRHNIGIATGMGSGVFVLDIDPAKGGDDTIWNLESRHGKLPHTWEVVTPTGGAHKFFKAVPDLPTSAGTLGDGLDIRGEGGQVVAAGSRRACGTYEWELSCHPDDIPLAEAPEWLLEMIFKGGVASSKHYSGPAVRESFADWKKIVAGCPALAYAAGPGQAKMGRPAWRHGVLNIASFCESPSEIAHEASRDHPQYSHRETEWEITNAVSKTHAPVKCSTMAKAYGLEEFCAQCSHRGKVNTPLTLGKAPIESWRAGGVSQPLPEGVEAQPERPCYTEIAGDKLDFSINGSDRRKVFFALASQDRKQRHSPRVAFLSLNEINERRCIPKFQKRELEEVIGNAYATSTVPTSGCPSLQAVGLCPAALGRAYCPLHESEQKKRIERVVEASKEEGRLCIAPMAALWVVPPIFYPTVEGKQVRVPGEFMTKWAKFQEYLATHPDVGKLIAIHKRWEAGADGKRHRIPNQEVWEEVFNEAMESRIDLPLPPEEATPAGIAWEGVVSFIRSTKLTENREDLKRGHILVEGDRHYFRGPDLLAYLKLFGINALEPGQLWDMMRLRGADHGSMWVAGKSYKVWSIPSRWLEYLSEPTAEDRRLEGTLL